MSGDPTIRGTGESSNEEESIIEKKTEIIEEVSEWSLPVKFIVRQAENAIGKEFKKEERIDFYVSQNTQEPGPIAKTSKLNRYFQ